MSKKGSFCISSGFLTIHVWLGEEPPPAGPSAGEDNRPQELPTAQLHCIHFCSRLVHKHNCVQEKRQNHQSAHAGNLSAFVCCSPKYSSFAFRPSLLFWLLAGCNAVTEPLLGSACIIYSPPDHLIICPPPIYWSSACPSNTQTRLYTFYVSAYLHHHHFQLSNNRKPFTAHIILNEVQPLQTPSDYMISGPDCPYG